MIDKRYMDAAKQEVNTECGMRLRIVDGQEVVAVTSLDSLRRLYRYAVATRAKLMQVDDVLTVGWIAVEDDDYRQALNRLVEFNIQVHDDPAASEVARHRKEQFMRMESEIDRLTNLVKKYEEKNR